MTKSMLKVTFYKKSLSMSKSLQGFEVVCHLISNTCILSSFRNNFAKYKVCLVSHNNFFQRFS